MSSSLLSEFSPRRNRRNPTLLALNQHSRNALSRILKHKTFKDEITSFYARQSEGMPPIPIYLTNSVYAQLLKQQYLLYTDICNPSKIEASQKLNTQKYNLMDRDEDMDSIFNNSYLASSSASDQPIISQKRMPTAQEVEALQSSLTNDSFKLSLALQDLRLPTAWDIKDRGEHIDISLDHLKLTYRGNGKDDTDVSSIRANFAMRKQCGIYYFEIQIISKGVDGHIGVGFCRKINSLDRYPGWEEHSWGYHGENGSIFSGPGTGKSYGPKFGTGDVIGCGVDFRDMSAFYTKNGNFLGTAFQKIKDADLYPFVGFKTPGEKIEANFGAKPFKFDIQQFLASEKQGLLNCIALKPTSTSRSNTINDYLAKEIADKVVIEYLNHNGYDKAAKSLEKALILKGSTVKDEECLDTVDLESIHRREIRSALLDGEIDQVFRLCSEHYPDVLEKNPMVIFRLKCRKFMEMVRQIQVGNTFTNKIDDEYEAESLEISENMDTIPAKRTATKTENDNFKNKKKKQKISTEDDLSSFSAAMAYGNQLKEEYKEESKNNETIRSELMAAFSTLAYADLNDPAVAYLFETPQIELVASELNSAILVSLGKYPNSSLERIYRQTNAAIELLVLMGNAKAALLQPEQDCLNSLNL